MKVRVSLLAGTVLVAGCGIIGGKKSGSVMQPVPTAPPAAAPAASSSGAQAAPRPGATQPMSPADYRGPASATVSASTATGATVPSANSLYTRLGGLDAIRTVVHDFAGRVMADDRISAFFRGIEMDKFERLLTEFMCQATGGPCSYTGRSMRAAHADLNLTDAHFNALVEDLSASLDNAGVRPADKSELLTTLATLRGDIVGH